MERHAFAMKVKDDMMNSYRQKLGEIWKDLTLFLDRNQVKNFSIWNTERLIFGYYEKEDDAELNAEEKAVRDVLIEKMAETFEWISEPGQDMRLMYHNKDGCEEEYKARHDGLIAQRGDTVDPGPDSNFTIWSAGGYIFGYDEIDTTMEVDETPEARETTVAWETRQLEIMDWITDDVDWMTGEWHPASRRLAWHN